MVKKVTTSKPQPAFADMLTLTPKHKDSPAVLISLKDNHLENYGEWYAIAVHFIPFVLIFTFLQDYIGRLDWVMTKRSWFRLVLYLWSFAFFSCSNFWLFHDIWIVEIEWVMTKRNWFCQRSWFFQERIFGRREKLGFVTSLFSWVCAHHKSDQNKSLFGRQFWAEQ